MNIVSSNWKTEFTDVENREKKKILKLRKKLDAIESESYDAISQSMHEVTCLRFLLLTFIKIHSKREGWRQRSADGIYESLPEDCQPLRSPLQEEYTRLILLEPSIDSLYKTTLGQFHDSQELLALGNQVTQWKSTYLQLEK